MSLSYIAGIVWGLPTIILIVGTGAFLSYKLKFIQIKNFSDSFRQLLNKNQAQKAGVHPLKALCTEMSSTIGTGNIAGVATAIYIGGPGAVFWMWFSAFFGMATKYTETYFAMMHRNHKTGHGGPMYYIERGLGENYKFLAVLFAFFGLIASFGIGNTVQANTVAKSLFFSFGINSLLVGLIIAIIVAFVIMGGIKRISNISSLIVPFMSFSYIVLCLYCIIIDYQDFIPTIKEIFVRAFDFKSASGGILGSTMMIAMQSGVSRGVFSNEAGLGSGAIAHAASNNNCPKSQGLIAMQGVFIDTFLICTLTAFVIINYGVFDKNGVDLTVLAVSKKLYFGKSLISTALIFFSFSTMVGWSYYCERCFIYLFGGKYLTLLRLLWVAAIPYGAIQDMGEIWLFSDICNALMAYPNLISIFLLAHKEW